MIGGYEPYFDGGYHREGLLGDPVSAYRVREDATFEQLSYHNPSCSDAATSEGTTTMDTEEEDTERTITAMMHRHEATMTATENDFGNLTTTVEAATEIVIDGGDEVICGPSMVVTFVVLLLFVACELRASEKPKRTTEAVVISLSFLLCLE